MDALISGILHGLALSILTGPLLFTLIQTSIEEGFRAGMSIGGGIWISDVLFILAAFFGVAYITNWMTWEGFNLTLGIIGGLILMGTGLGLVLIKPPHFHDFSKFGIRYNSYFSLLTKGFLINTVNPFTFAFWFLYTVPLVAEFQHPNASIFFYSGILGTIVFTDGLKVVLAKSIQKKMKPNVVLWMRRVAGGLLVVFGIILMIRVVFDVGTESLSLL